MTKATQRVYSALLDHMAEHGVSPTYRELGADLGLSVATVFEYVQRLKDEGLVLTGGTKGESIKPVPGATITAVIEGLAGLCKELIETCEQSDSVCLDDEPQRLAALVRRAASYGVEIGD